MRGIEATHQDTDGYADDILAGLRWTFDPAEIRVPVRSWHGTDDRSAPFGLTRMVVRRPVATWSSTRGSGTTWGLTPQRMGDRLVGTS